MYYDGLKLHDEISRRQQTVAEFAQSAGVSRPIVYRALAGARATTRSLGRIAAALGVDRPSDLLKTEPVAQM